MYILKTLSDLEKFKKEHSNKKMLLGLVPTMGALHAGHLALVKAAQKECDQVMVSIFVNPTQFDQGSDLDRYPREHERDIALLKDVGCTAVWVPDTSIIYPEGFATHIMVEGPARQWEGARRPGHFSGVATVVSRLFGLIKPDFSYFGEKDWQQLQVVRRMVIDLAFPVIIKGIPIIRENDGLAMSSRNRFLSPDERTKAPSLYENLLKAREKLRKESKTQHILEETQQALQKAGFDVDYLALVDGHSLASQDRWTHTSRLICAARLGSVRLLDNIGEY